MAKMRLLRIQVYDFCAFFPCTDFSELTDVMLAEIEWKLNQRPRKSQGLQDTVEIL